ncbi:MAG: PhzF family phenazine biosynthesis protein [Candidatus Heimdallarchaeota archaeon]
MKKLPFIQTSVFADDRFSFSGNQLATFWKADTNDISTEEMQGITREMNFSETTFILESKIEKCAVKVRIFTPGRELDFAGHPTLGTAFVLKHKGIVEESIKKSVLELGIGPIDVEFISREEIGMVQPKPQFLDKYTNKENIATILGLSVDDIMDDFPMQVVSTGFPFLIVPVKSRKIIKSIKLNPQLQIDMLSDFLTSKLVVFTRETEFEDSNAHVRMFAPSVGVIEDPATGSAAGPLGAYLEHWKVIEGHKESEKMILEQGYEIQRPSKLVVQTIVENSEIQNVSVSGKVKLTAEGDFFL